MSTAHLRLMAVAVTAIAAALTGVATGLVATPAEGESFAVVPALAGFGGAALTGAVLVVLLIAATKGTAGKDTASRSATVDSADAIHNLTAHVDQLGSDRSALVNTAVYVRDRTNSKAIADRIGATLHEVGVVTLVPTGVPFDPQHHEAGGHTPAPDAQSVGVIAAVEVPGYVDRGTLLRAPVVTVFRGREA